MRKILLGLTFFITLNVFAGSELQWNTLPATPQLPKAESSGYANINNIQIWYATFGQGEPVILLHGGLTNSNYWGNQIPELAKHYKVIVMDSRGHGRSTRDQQPLSYSLMSTDVLALMDHLKINKASIVGWSDGAIIGLNLALHHPERLKKLFAFAANTNPNGVKKSAGETPVFKTAFKRFETEYQQLSKTPKEFPELLKQVTTMWATQPNLTDKQLKSITVPTWIVAGDRDEGIKRENSETQADLIPNSGLLVLPQVGHFAFMQDPTQFTQNVLRFLEKPL